MQDDLVWLYLLASANIAQDIGRQVAQFILVHGPANYLAAEDVEKQVQIIVSSSHSRRQIRDVPAVELVWRRGTQGRRLLPNRGVCAGSMLDLADAPQYAIEGRFTADIQAFVGQPGHNLAWRQMAKLRRVDGLQDTLTFQLRETIRRRLHA